MKDREANQEYSKRMATNSGFSLVTVTSLGIVVMLWIFAISASVLSMYQAAAEGKYVGILRNAAEAGLDYAVSQLNSSISNGVMSSSLDDGGWHTVPSSAMPDSGATVSIMIAKQSPPSTSAIYWANADPTQNTLITTSSWRVVTATAKYAGLKKAIRIVLAPVYSNSGGNASTPYFSYAGFVNTSLTMSGSAYIDSYTPTYSSSAGTETNYASRNSIGGNVGSNNSPAQSNSKGNYAINMSGATAVYGSVNVFSSNAGGNGYLVYSTGGSGDVVANSSGVITHNYSGPQITNQIVTNGVNGSSGATGSGTSINFSGSIGSAYQATTASPYYTPTYSTASAQIVNSTTNSATATANGATATTPLASTNSLSDPITAPSNEPVVSATITQVGYSGAATYTVKQMPGDVVNLGALTVNASNTYNIPPGDYQVTSLTVDGAGILNLVAGSSGAYGPVRFFVSGPASGYAVDVEGSGVVNNKSMSAGNFQVWYSGSQGVNLAGAGKTYGVIYAPGAPITISGSGILYGAAVGNSLNISGAAIIHYDTLLGTNPSNWSLGYNTQSQMLTNLQAITWQEPRTNTEEAAWADPSL